jgi:hypothetical protein
VSAIGLRRRCGGRWQRGAGRGERYPHDLDRHMFDRESIVHPVDARQ